MKQAKKIIYILTMLTILLGINFSYAIDLNLTDDASQNISANDTNTENETMQTNTNATNTNSASTNTSTSNGSSFNPSTTVSNMNTSSGLELANILNILLIVIGILLILLSIAILIRLKK